MTLQHTAILFVLTISNIRILKVLWNPIPFPVQLHISSNTWMMIDDSIVAMAVASLPGDIIILVLSCLPGFWVEEHKLNHVVSINQIPDTWFMPASLECCVRNGTA